MGGVWKERLIDKLEKLESTRESVEGNCFSEIYSAYFWKIKIYRKISVIASPWLIYP